MPYNSHISLLLSAGIFGLVAACQQTGVVQPVEPVEPPGVIYQPTPYPWIKPANFPEPAYDLRRNPLTYEGVALGKTLFFDGRLSRDGTISCGFCHIPESAFAHTDHALSHGINDQRGPRNGMGIQNVAWNKAFFWDGGIHDLDLVPLSPIQNPVEMGDTMTNVLRKVRTSARYTPLFRAAFGSDEVSSERLLKALSQFMLTFVSADSKYDKYRRGEGGGGFNEQELRGLSLFTQHCSGCHAGELFTDQSFRNNGLLPNPNVKNPDLGRYTITLNEADKYKFRVPSLRNVERTMPYMHDGRLANLESVLAHYATGVQDNYALDPLLRKDGRLGLSLNKQEQKDIITFLYTLTDDTFLNSRKFKP